METLLLNSNSKKDINLLLDIANKLGIDLKIVPKEEEKIITKEKLFYKKIENAIKESKEIASGKKIGKKLSDTLNEI
ncbi:hypothetical protein [Flavobacterium sp.]|jgi:hypothetical protein|uniref:hypothetical protein n=1 Tax=Flavobacterium sp. TaxID=239 RepID=UPI0037C17B28